MYEILNCLYFQYLNYENRYINIIIIINDYCFYIIRSVRKNMCVIGVIYINPKVKTLMMISFGINYKIENKIR